MIATEIEEVTESVDDHDLLTTANAATLAKSILTLPVANTARVNAKTDMAATEEASSEIGIETVADEDAMMIDKDRVAGEICSKSAEEVDVMTTDVAVKIATNLHSKRAAVEVHHPRSANLPPI